MSGKTFAPFRKNIPCLICGTKIEKDESEAQICTSHLENLPRSFRFSKNEVLNLYDQFVKKKTKIWAFIIVYMAIVLPIVMKYSDPSNMVMFIILICVFILPIMFIMFRGIVELPSNNTTSPSFPSVVKDLYSAINPAETQDPKWFQNLVNNPDFNNLYRRLKYFENGLMMNLLPIIFIMAPISSRLFWI
jgi:hypothetical protein